ncbi:Uncharacterized protein dnl_40130 [Desulfonema limicola]|uniref:DUF2281 domain-containing protein n=1 Tax=Desulfonema limicola TaxID=45656 RepID=A0A975BAC0_9BACT|nr:hypothetical protein [Desulfonema limicola]QTA81670.1 Uncharacterized protein dnl_40130 [Desulfonema limicola]
MNNLLIPEVVDNINYLPYNLQKQVLNYVKQLKKTYENRMLGKSLLNFAGSISKEDLKIMTEVIEKDCGQVDLNEW